MYLQGKYVTDITAEDIEDLFKYNVKESKDLDYKREISLDDKDNKKQNFIIDVMAMYNTEGGCIIYGIEEKKNEKKENTGYPEEIVNQEISNKDRFEQQLHAIIKDNTDPSITNIVIHFLIVRNKQIFIVGVPRSLGLPSMITYRGLCRFHRRTTSGNYAILTVELNQMFLQNQSVKEKAAFFRNSRIRDLKTGIVYPDMKIEGDFFLHLIPYSFLEERIYELPNLLKSNLGKKLFPVNSESYYSENRFEYNLDGLFTYKFENGQKGITSYIQYFRNGIIEIYTNKCYSNDNGRTFLYGNEIVTTTMFTISNMVEVYKKLEIELPFIVSVNLLEVKNCTFLTPPSTVLGKFLRQDIILPSVLITTYDFTFHELFDMLKPILDILWQGVNHPECPSIENFIKFRAKD